MVNKLLIILLSCTLSSFVSGQINSPDPENDKMLTIELPPLAELFESARNNPAVEIYNIRKQQEISALKTEKRSWLKYFKITATYQYGSVGYNSYMSTTEIAPIYTSSGSKQSWYNFGGGLSIPLDDLFDRGNRIKRQKLLMKQTELEIEKWHDEQKLLIVDAYSNALESLAVLKIKAEALVFSNAQYKISENDFINGKITISALNKEKGIQSSSVAEYEKTRASLYEALLRLEILSKTKIFNR